MVKREKLNTEIRQEQIIKAAMNLIARRGLKGLSMTALANRIGLVPSAIYRHFKSKNDIVDMILDFIRERLLTNIRITCKETSDPMERLQRILRRHVETLRENRAIPRIIFTEDVFSGNPKRKTKVYRIINGYLQGLNQIIRDGQKMGEIRSDIDSKTVALMFLGMIQPGVILWFLSDGKFDISKESERNWNVFREAISAN
ncbi:MAG: TetR family transcriptional regulator [Deltaproteobacteria bacterium RBG_16_47_11]|nr:MAG: TetR family transcriptional regulator [Deltaproteobacteria bacterium RBG_16_47_11]